MTTETFNENWHKISEKELLPVGFIRVGNCYLNIQGTSVFQFSKYTFKSKFHGFLFGYTQTFFESWSDEYPNKWPLNLEQLCFVFSNSQLEKCDLNKLSEGIILAFDYSNGKHDLSLEFPLYELDQENEDVCNEYINKCVLLAKNKGLELNKKLTPTLTMQLLEGKTDESFMPHRWLTRLKTLPNNS